MNFLSEHYYFAVIETGPMPELIGLHFCIYRGCQDILGWRLAVQEESEDIKHCLFPRIWNGLLELPNVERDGHQSRCVERDFRSRLR